MDNRNKFYMDAIYATIPNATEVHTPAVMGAKKNVLFVDTDIGCRYTVKFNGFDMAVRNSVVSKTMLDACIPVPNVHILNHNDMWFEAYPSLPGITLFEYMQTCTSKQYCENLYNQIIQYFYKMSQIDLSKLTYINLPKAYQVAYHDTNRTHNAIYGKLCSYAVYLMNLGKKSDMGIYHYGITPKNILVSQEGNFIAFIDVDEIGICNKNYAFGVMAAKAQQFGINLIGLCDEYENISSQHLNRNHISAVANINNIGRNLLWRISQKNKKK